MPRDPDPHLDCPTIKICICFAPQSGFAFFLHLDTGWNLYFTPESGVLANNYVKVAQKATYDEKTDDFKFQQ